MSEYGLHLKRKIVKGNKKEEVMRGQGQTQNVTDIKITKCQI